MKHHLILLAALLAGGVSCGSDFECDEDSVQTVCLPEDYDSFLPPKEGRVNISVSAEYIQVVEVNEEELSITFDVFLNLEWVEPRLQLQPGHKSLTPVNAKIIEDVWLPNVYIYNLETFEVVEVLSPMSGVWVGADKTLLYSQAARVTLYCQMDFAWFPFDTQVCRFRLGSYSYDDTKVRFITKTINTNPKTPNSLPYDITSKSFDSEESMINYGDLGNFSIAGGKIMIARHASSYISSYYFPSGLLVLVSMMSFLIPTEDRLCRVFLLLVPLMMEIHLLTSATHLVPSSGLTQLEVWIVASVCFSLLALLEFAGLMTMKLHKKEGGLNEERVDRISMLVILFVYIVFVIIYAPAIA